jgi:glycosyl transferase family 87
MRIRERLWMVRIALPRMLVLALCIGYGISNTIWSATQWEIPDIGAYWNAALRLREGLPLYPAVSDVNASEVYRYAPWFAYLWIPLTYLPRSLVDGLWSVALVGASIAVVIPAIRLRTAAALAFTAIGGSFLILIASRGNVQPLMIAALVYGVERRSGPVWIALCASLKATPILYVLVYLGRGEYRKAALTVGLTAILVVPMLFFGVESYTADPGSSHSLYTISPVLYVTVAAASVAVAAYVAWRHRHWAWLATSIAVVICLPRYFPYEFTFLFVGLVPVVDAWRRRREGPDRA